jgi:hypothetical protein
MKRLIQALALALLLLLLTVPAARAQQKDEKAFRILDAAIGLQEEQLDLSIRFEAIAYGIANPLEVFSLPADALHKGGYFYMKGAQYEIELGLIKALCDGQLSVLVNEQDRLMIVDSVRSNMPALEGEAQQPDLGELLKENLYNGALSYEGQEEVNNHRCHKIKAHFPDAPDTYVLYWVREKDHTLLLMAERQQGSFDVYQVNKVGKSPKNHQYTIHLPAEEISDFHGYEVVDFRFAMQELNGL